MNWEFGGWCIYTIDTMYKLIFFQLVVYKQSVVQSHQQYIEMNYWYLTTWMDLENISSESWIRKKIACCMIPSMDYPRKGKTPVTESSSVWLPVAGYWEGFWLPRGVRELEGWWNYSMFWLWCWMNDCMLNEKRWILLYVNIPPSKRKHGREKPPKDKMLILFRLKPIIYWKVKHSF